MQSKGFEPSQALSHEISSGLARGIDYLIIVPTTNSPDLSLAHLTTLATLHKKTKNTEYKKLYNEFFTTLILLNSVFIIFAWKIQKKNKQ